MTSSWDDVDFAHTQTADRNRLVKARTLADLAWQYGIPAADVAAWPQPVRNRFARTAGVNTPNRLSPTWDLVTDLLDQMAAWADQHPWDDRSWQRRTHERPTWTRSPEGPTTS